MNEPADAAGPLAALRIGGKRALAQALARLEAKPDAEDVRALLDAAWAAQRGHALGLTGPPGVGKSTLIDALIRVWRARGRSVAVIAVDPSSRRSGGALLGDRTRLSTDPDDAGVFVRSMAARDRLGGLAAITWPALVLMRALYDVVVVETVGVGQSETEIADLADTVLFCAQPGSGDALQFMKAGVMEIPHLAVVTKGDMGVVATRAVADLKGALSLAAPGAEEVAVLRCAAATGEGVPELVDALEARMTRLSAGGSGARARAAQMAAWARRAVSESFGVRGLALVERDLDAATTAASPFSVVARATDRLSRALSGGFAST